MFCQIMGFRLISLLGEQVFQLTSVPSTRGDIQKQFRIIDEHWLERNELMVMYFTFHCKLIFFPLHELAASRTSTECSILVPVDPKQWLQYMLVATLSDTK